VGGQRKKKKKKGACGGVGKRETEVTLRDEGKPRCCGGGKITNKRHLEGEKGIGGNAKRPFAKLAGEGPFHLPWWLGKKKKLVDPKEEVFFGVQGGG